MKSDKNGNITPNDGVVALPAPVAFFRCIILPKYTNVKLHFKWFYFFPELSEIINAISNNIMCRIKQGLRKHLLQLAKMNHSVDIHPMTCVKTQ